MSHIEPGVGCSVDEGPRFVGGGGSVVAGDASVITGADTDVAGGPKSSLLTLEYYDA